MLTVLSCSVVLCIFESDTCTLNHLPFRYASIFRVHYACVEIEGTFFFSLSCVSVISCLLQFSRLALVFASYWCCTFALHPFKCICVWIVGSILHAVLSTAFKCAFRFMPLLSTTHQFTLCMSCETPPILKSACQREMENICVWVCVCLFHIN